MSYFIILSGANVRAIDVPIGRLIPTSEAQAYVARLAPQINALDGDPAMLWDDGETGTSDEIVCAVESDVLEGLSLDALPLISVIKNCESHHVSVRVWWANNDPLAFSQVPEVVSAAEALTLFKKNAGNGSSMGVVLHP